MADDLRPVTTPEAVEMGPLTDSLGFLLRLAQLASFEDFYAGLAPFGIRPGEFSALLIIRQNPGIRQGVLAQRLIIKRAHMTKMIRAFEDAGFVERTIPDDDRRSVELRLSPGGEALVAEHIGHFTSFEAREKLTLTAAEESELRRLLRKYLALPEGENK
ncbi:MarR family winged helix-turn-helix transcriptional regulator [Halodurantibacterium flavum]|uniref:MarR family winged helix-turn-helix transcriptional regulator n=1 Tax=Halodurantibacterium flavum TaxID=1382802 RepID=A0ABW4S8F3_9RHOB